MLEPGTLNTPFFSVIINCHNSELYLRDALESVLSQTFQDYELIVFDNASTDTTAIIAKSFGSGICYYFSEVKLSLGAARNKAIMKAKGEYIAFLDSDDWWTKDKLEICIKNIDDNIDFIYHDLEIRSNNPKIFSKSLFLLILNHSKLVNKKIKLKKNIKVKDP